LKKLAKLKKSIPVQEMESTPGPKYSTIAPVPPFTVRMPATLRMTSVKTNSHQQNYRSLLPPSASYGRHGVFMVSALDCAKSGLVLSPGWELCAVFLGRTHYSHSSSFHPCV